MKKKDDKLWVERYRPTKLDDVVGQTDTVNELRIYSTNTKEKKQMPHFLFTGPAGTGKTTLAKVLVRLIQGDVMKRKITYLELNASDKRGIDVVRYDIKDFAQNTCPVDVPFKIIILDEVDSMTGAAQQALRRTMEKFAGNCRFILCCNYSNKIIEPIQSRCSFHKFAPLTDEQIMNRLKYIAEKEEVVADDGAFQALAYISDGDIRKAINYFQAASVMDDLVTADVVYQISGQIDPHEIMSLITLSLDKKLEEARAQLIKLFDEFGMSATNIIKQMSRELHKMSVEDRIKFSLDRIIGETEFRVIQGATERIQMGALISKIVLLSH